MRATLALNGLKAFCVEDKDFKYKGILRFS